MSEKLIKKHMESIEKTVSVEYRELMFNNLSQHTFGLQKQTFKMRYNDQEIFDKLSPEKQECVSRKISINIKEHPEWDRDQVVAVSFSQCGASRKTSKSIEFSNVEYEDIQQICFLNNKLVNLFKYSLQDLNTYFAPFHTKQISKVARNNHIVVGYAIMKQVNKNTQHLLQIAVDCNYQRKGIGKQLMLNIMDNATDEIKLEVRETNNPAINLYKSLGFTKTRILSKFYNDADGIEFIWKRKKFEEGKHSRDTSGKFSEQEEARQPKAKRPSKPPKGKKPPESGNVSKKEAKYTSKSKVKGQKCSNCRFIIRKKETGVRYCTKVEGSIADSGWSVFWKASKKELDPTRV